LEITQASRSTKIRKKGNEEEEAAYHEAGLAGVAIPEQADLEADDVLGVHRVGVGCREALVVDRDGGEHVPGLRRAEAAVLPATAPSAGGACEQLVPDEAHDPGGDGEAEQARPPEVEP
jgi:hypothetical protein